MMESAAGRRRWRTTAMTAVCALVLALFSVVSAAAGPEGVGAERQAACPCTKASPDCGDPAARRAPCCRGEHHPVAVASTSAVLAHAHLVFPSARVRIGLGEAPLWLRRKADPPPPVRGPPSASARYLEHCTLLI